MMGTCIKTGFPIWWVHVLRLGFLYDGYLYYAWLLVIFQLYCITQLEEFNVVPRENKFNQAITWFLKWDWVHVSRRKWPLQLDWVHLSRREFVLWLDWMHLSKRKWALQLDWLIDLLCLMPLSEIFQLYHGDHF
jgi:hypothetical protein